MIWRLLVIFFIIHVSATRFPPNFQQSKKFRFATKVGQRIEYCSIQPRTAAYDICQMPTYKLHDLLHTCHRGNSSRGLYLEMHTNIPLAVPPTAAVIGAFTHVCFGSDQEESSDPEFSLGPIKGSILSKSRALWGLHFCNEAALSVHGCHVNTKPTQTSLRPRTADHCLPLIPCVPKSVPTWMEVSIFLSTIGQVS